MTAIDLLRADHRQFMQLFEQVRQTLDFSERRELFEEIRDRLAWHSEVEEEIFYPRFSVFPELVELMAESSEDHQLFNEMIADISSAYEVEEFNELLEEFIDVIEDHITEEESEVFPRLEAFLSEEECETFQRELGELGYKFQFITLAGFHSVNLATFELAEAYAQRGMAGYSEMQQREFAAQTRGFTTVKHQREVGVSYFDIISEAVGATSTVANKSSTEADQFH